MGSLGFRLQGLAFTYIRGEFRVSALGLGFTVVGFLGFELRLYNYAKKAFFNCCGSSSGSEREACFI